MAGIENLKASIESAKELSVAVKKIAADGIGFSDIPEVPGLIAAASDLFAAAKAAKEAGEMADLDGAEIKELLFALIDLGSDVYGLMKA
jgi:hypothetical protein